MSELHEGEEIEVTLEMIEAGRKVFRNNAPDAEEMMSNADSGAMVAAIFRAMLKVERRA